MDPGAGLYMTVRPSTEAKDRARRHRSMNMQRSADDDLPDMMESLSYAAPRPSFPPRSDSLPSVPPRMQFAGATTSLTRSDSAVGLGAWAVAPIVESEHTSPRVATFDPTFEPEVPAQDPPPSYVESGYVESVGAGTPILISLKNYAYFHESAKRAYVGPCIGTCTDLALLTPTSEGPEVLQPCIDRAARIFRWHETEDDVPQALEVHVTLDGKKVHATQGNWPAIRMLLLDQKSGARLHVAMSQDVVGELEGGKKAACWLRKVGRHLRGDTFVL